MFKISNRTFLGPFLLLSVIAAGYSAYWYYAAGKAKEKFSNVVKVCLTQGHFFAFSDVILDGFPHLVRLKIKNPSLRTALKQVRWEGSEAIIEMQPWDFWKYRITLPGTHRFDISRSGFGVPLTYEPNETSILVRFFTNGRLAGSRIDVETSRLFNGAKDLLASAGRMQLNLTQPETREIGVGKTWVSLFSQVENLEVPEGQKVQIGGKTRQIQFVADFRNASLSAFTHEALQKWQTAGGLVDISWFDIMSAPLFLRGRGSVGLDPQLRPVVSITSDIRGFSETLSALEQSKIVEPDAAAAMRVALTVLAKTSPKDGEKILSVPLTTRNGELRIGPFKLLKLKPIKLPSRSD
ncbi:MAG: DUF2125 domain-containing protein [Pseudomonadota bacterium]|nr:DUF2125 domain-containing protein [Pseudomonadota bacterium]